MRIALFDGRAVQQVHDEFVIEGPFNYNDDWSLLMPVVEKLCRLDIYYKPSCEGESTETFNPYPRTFGMRFEHGPELMVRLNNSSICYAKSLLQATFEAVSDFIYDNGLHIKNGPIEM